MSFRRPHYSFPLLRVLLLSRKCIRTRANLGQSYVRHKKITMTFGKSNIQGGIYTPVTTFFKNEKCLSLDLNSQAEHAKMLYKSGISGLVVAGSMGECTNLTIYERLSVVKSMRGEIPDKNFKIIMGTPPISSIEDIVKESSSAADVGADVLLVLVPGFFGAHLTSQQGLIDYFERLANNSKLPIMIYNYPSVSNNVTLSMSTFERLSCHENIMGVKLTHSDLGLYTYLGNESGITGNSFICFTGLGQLLLPAMVVGTSGAIDALSAIFPKTMVHLYKLCKDGKMKEASKLQFHVSKAEVMVADLNVVGVKYALKELYGVGECVTGRAPLSTQVNLDAYNKYPKDLQTLQEIEKSL